MIGTGQCGGWPRRANHKRLCGVRLWQKERQVFKRLWVFFFKVKLRFGREPDLKEVGAEGGEKGIRIRLGVNNPTVFEVVPVGGQ